LRFIEDLSDDYQIIYSTHSPFMIASDSLNRVRTVLETHLNQTKNEKNQLKPLLLFFNGNEMPLFFTLMSKICSTILVLLLASVSSFLSI
jgi:predicted ATP-binding protein involved in virulence